MTRDVYATSVLPVDFLSSRLVQPRAAPLDVAAAGAPPVASGASAVVAEEAAAAGMAAELVADMVKRIARHLGQAVAKLESDRADDLRAGGGAPAKARLAQARLTAAGATRAARRNTAGAATGGATGGATDLAAAATTADALAAAKAMLAAAAAAAAAGAAAAAAAARVRVAERRTASATPSDSGDDAAPMITAGAKRPVATPTGRNGGRGPWVRTEFASMLADPPLPTFRSADEPAGAAVSLSSPAEQGLWRDISLANRVMSALRSSDLHFEVVFRDAPTALAVASRTAGQPDTFLYVNPALCRLLGYSPMHLLDMTLNDLEHPDRESQLYDGESCRTSRWSHADGRTLTVRIRTAPMITDNASQDHLIYQLEDLGTA